MTMQSPPGITTDWRASPGPTAYLAWVDSTSTSNWVTFDVVDTEKWEEGAEITEHPVEQGANVGDHVRVKLITCELRVFVSQEPLDASPFTGAVATSLLATPSPATLAMPTPSWVPQGGVIVVPQWNSQIDLRVLGQQLVGLGGRVAPGGIPAPAGLALVAAEDLALPGFPYAVPVPTNAGLLPPGPTPPISPVVQQYDSPLDFVEQMHSKLVALKDSAQRVTVFGTKRVLSSMVIESLSFSRDKESGTGEDVTIGLKQIRIVQTQQVPAPIQNLPAGGGKPPANHGGQTPKPPPNAVDSVLKWLDSQNKNPFGGVGP